MWKSEDGRALITNDGLIEIIAQSKRQVILLEGPTNCGKTRLTMRVEDAVNGRMLRMPVDVFRTQYLYSLKTENILNHISDNDILCMEDIDLFSKDERFLGVFAFYLGAAAQEKVVLLDGIDCTKRVGTLIDKLRDRCRTDIYEFAPDGADDNENT